MKSFRVVFLSIGLGIICLSVTGSESTSFYDWVSYHWDHVKSYFEKSEQEGTTGEVSSDIGRDRVRRSPKRPPPQWKLNFKKFRSSPAGRKSAKANFYKNWKPAPFVPITRPPPVIIETSSSAPTDTAAVQPPPGTAPAQPATGTAPEQKPTDTATEQKPTDTASEQKPTDTVPEQKPTDTVPEQKPTDTDKTGST